MKSDVLVSFKGANSYEADDSDNLEFITTGSFIKKGDKYYLKYKELADEKSNGDIFTTLKIENNKVTILRQGLIDTQMIVEKGRKHMSYYETPGGSYTISVISKDVNVEIEGSNGKIHLNYDVELNNVLASRNKINLTFSEV